MTRFELLCFATPWIRNRKEPPMKLIFTFAGLALIVIAAIYFLMPADALPSFFPGHETGLARMRYKHGMVSGAAGLVLLAIGWFLGRR
jgi:hypothetical protein